MHHYQHHIGDYEAAASHLSWEEDLAYTRLLRIYYRDEKPIPNFSDQIFRLVRAKTKKQRIAVDRVLAEFFVLAEDGWHNKRCDKEIERFQEKSEKSKAAADERWKRSERNANAMRTHSDADADAMPTANRKPLTVNREPKVHTESPPASTEPPPLPEVALAWNSIRGVIHVRDMTKARKKHLAARLADPAWLMRWKDGIERVNASKFCQGQSESGWKADFDWFIKPDSLIKILEGKYDDRSGTPITRPGHNGSRTPNILEREQQREDQQLEILRQFAEGGGPGEGGAL